eukprot:TRINITY_DN1401_c0_g1_i1.p4 TRINITY_DN1401_c0_g1~~TRINITY_DN1401_c0_g1_i1.p4  ORF type:complete len:110 (-),score=31.93 TRINITY_DN1401_c0_g1_i1:2-331(-)
MRLSTIRRTNECPDRRANTLLVKTHCVALSKKEQDAFLGGGFNAPDLTDASTVAFLQKWDGNARFLNKVKFRLFTELKPDEPDLSELLPDDELDHDDDDDDDDVDADAD